MSQWTSVGLKPETKDALREYKYETRARSFDEAVERLLTETDVDIDVTIQA